MFHSQSPEAFVGAGLDFCRISNAAEEKEGVVKGLTG